MQTTITQKTLPRDGKSAQSQDGALRRLEAQRTAFGLGCKAAYRSLPPKQKSQYARALLDRYYRSQNDKGSDEQEKQSAASSGSGTKAHLAESGRSHGGSSGSFGAPLSYREYQQRTKDAKQEIALRSLDWLGTAAGQTQRGMTGSSVSPDQQLADARRQAENVRAVQSAKDRLQSLRELGHSTPRTEELTGAQKAVDRILGDRTQITGEKTDWGKLIQGALYKGSDLVMTGLGDTVGMLFGGLSEELHVLGIESVNTAVDMINTLPGGDLRYVEPMEEGSLLKHGIQRLHDLARQNQAYFAPNANSSRAAQIVDRLGTDTVAAAPLAISALLSAGSSAAEMTGEGLSYLSGLEQSAGTRFLSQAASTGLQKVLRDPQFWFSYVTSAGDGYQSALEDGFSKDDAAGYGLINGFFNALIETGGADAALGGFNRLPERLRDSLARGDKKGLLLWARSALDEGKEEIAQGVMARGLKAFGENNVPVLSFDPEDRDAILNPFSAAEEFAGGTAVGAILGGAQSAVARGGASFRQAVGNAESASGQDPNRAAYLRRLEQLGYLPAESSENAALDGAAGAGSLLQRVKDKLSNLAGKERAAAIREMSFGEQVSGIENGLILQREKPFANVRDTTPSVLVQKADADQLPIIMSYESAYLSARSEGAKQGHYHKLGAELMAQIPGAMEQPLALIRQSNGRIAEVLDLKDQAGKRIYLSIELSAVKDIDGENRAYNLIITAFGASEKYIMNRLNQADNHVLENKLPGEDPQVNPRRNELPGTING